MFTDIVESTATSRGRAANLAARVEQAAAPGSIYVSSTMHDLLLGDDLELADRGRHELKGFAEARVVYEVV